MTLKQWLVADAPIGWPGVVARTVTTSLLGFVVFQVKEWAETHGFDTADALIGSAWLAVFTFIVATLLQRRGPR